MKLSISKELQMPIDAITQTMAQIGRKGSGKTYLATMIAEQMLDARAQVICIDPVGNWYGLRIGADGHSKGKEIFVVGGEHGDVPLVPEAGARIAKLLAEKRISAVLDVSAFRQGERKRFAADFAEEFFHLKKTQRSPVHIFIEEAQLFIPQRVGPDDARMVGAWESIVRLGRNYGIGASLVTQRPQSVNKEVLSQVECLFVLQVNGTHERKALEEWVQEAGAERELVGKLPGLERGQGFVWSPSWLRMFKQVHFSHKATFDASATPEVGKEGKAPRLSEVDVEELRSNLAEVVQAAEKDDPRALWRRIHQLEKELQEKPAAKPERVEVSILKDSHCARLEVACENTAKVIAEICGLLKSSRPPMVVMKKDVRVSPPGPIIHPVDMAQHVPFVSHSPVSGAPSPLSKAERRILQCLAQYTGATKKKVALITGYSGKGGGFLNALGSLSAKGLISRDREVLGITFKGITAVGQFDPLPTGTALVDHWMRQLSKAEGLILDALVYAYPETMTKQEIADKTSYAANGGGFLNALGRLRTLDLIEGYDAIKASAELFS